MKVSARFHFSCLPNLVVTLLFISLVCGSSGVHAIAQRQTAAASAVQPFDATNLYKPVEIGITGVVQAGDDPAYARPDYDDSRWLPVDANRRLHDYFPNSQPSLIWWRLHTRVNPVQIGLALQAYDISHAFEVFINGQKLFESGRVEPFVAYTLGAHLIERIPEPQLRTGSLVIAIRAHVTRSWWKAPGPGFDAANLTLGEETTLQNKVDLDNSRFITPYLFLSCLGFGVGLVALALFTVHRQQAEYLWIFIMGAVMAAFLVTIRTVHYNVPAVWTTLDSFLNFVWNLAEMGLCWSFLRRRINPSLWWTMILAFLLDAAAQVAFSYGSIGFAESHFADFPMLIVQAVILPWLLLRDLGRGNKEAGILLVPIVSWSLSAYADFAIAVMMQIPGFRTAGVRANLFIGDLFHIGAVNISLGLVGLVFFWLSLAIIMVFRSTRTSREQAVLEGQMAAAREVQQVIVPEKIEAFPGFAIESAYEPAQQVGGDFFQILPAGENGLLVLVGDVAGKGLPAAMLVSVLVGAIRSVAEYTKDPAEVLANLNERLIGRTRGGFSTALVARIDSEGLVTIANAGHLPPYLDGKEIDLPGTLPLGIVSGAKYGTSEFQLNPGSRLTFYSDGVIEAQNQKGELFGFERGREISTQPAATIAEAAKQFGQEDDITVISVTRTAVLEPAAA